MVDFTGHYGNDLAASLFFNVRIVSKTEFPPPIGVFIELHPCNVKGLSVKEFHK